MPACEECHRVKVRCDKDPLVNNGDPCSRCRRLDLECIGRPSRQGQGPKKRRKKEAIHNNTCEGSNNESEDVHVFQAQLESSSKAGRHHFGVRYLIHSWTSFAFARRSFALLGRASRLAAKCQIPMDEVYCRSRRPILDPILYNNNDLPTTTTPYSQRRLKWEDLPPALLQVCHATTATERENRYMFGRQAIEGHSRWFASGIFEEQIASVWLMEETWKANEMTVVKLFLDGPETFDKFTHIVNYQISRYTYPDKQPEPCRYNGFRIKFQQPPVVREMDAIYALQIVSLENSFYLIEFVPSKVDEGSNKTQKASSAAHDEVGKNNTKNAECESANPHDDDPLQSFDNLVPLEEMDQDFESFLALLNDD